MVTYDAACFVHPYIYYIYMIFLTFCVVYTTYRFMKHGCRICGRVGTLFYDVFRFLCGVYRRFYYVDAGIQTDDTMMEDVILLNKYSEVFHTSGACRYVEGRSSFTRRRCLSCTYRTD